MKDHETYQNLSKAEEEIKLLHGCEHYKKLSEVVKQMLDEYKKKNHRMKKCLFIIIRKICF